MRLGAKRTNTMPLLNHARLARYWTSMSVSLCPRMNVELFCGYTVARLVGSIAYLGLPVYDSLITRRWWSVARYFTHPPYFSLSNRIGAVLQMRCGQFDITCLSSLRVLHAQSSIRFLLGGPHKVPQSPFAVRHCFSRAKSKNFGKSYVLALGV